MAGINDNNISDQNRRGLQRDGTATSEYNRLHFAIEQQVRNSVKTMWIGRIDSCDTPDGASPSGTVSATSMTAQSDAQGQSLPMASVGGLPHTRYQHGIAAIIINPVPGDLVAFGVCKRDISTIGQDTTEPQRAGSYRQFDEADSVALGSVHTKEPEVYIELKQDKTIKVICPEGYTLETDADVHIKASGSVIIDAPEVTISGNLTVQGEVTGNGVVLSQHVHSGVDRGSSNTDRPV